MTGMDLRALSWLSRQREEDRPVLLFSGGPPGPEARWHCAAVEPRCLVVAPRAADPDRDPIRLLDPKGRVLDEARGRDFAPAMRRWTARALAEARDEGAVRGLEGTGEEGFGPGWFGSLGYDLAWWFEYGLPRRNLPESRLPVVHLGFYDRPLVLDRIEGGIRGPAREQEAFLALERIGEIPPLEGRLLADEFPREDYVRVVASLVEACREGRIFQADLTRRLRVGSEGGPMPLFLNLALRNPASHAAYFGQGPGRAFVSASPEGFLTVEGSALRTCPIKGSLAASPDPREDRRRRKALLASEKDRAELAMIVDLMRNDLGRIAAPGSVRVEAFPELLSLPWIHHLRARIRARAGEGTDLWDLLTALLPAGSISGAPKPMAVALLEERERSRRGGYTGVSGWFGAGGDARLAVSIRSAEVEEGEIRFGVGGGITALSDPEAEYEETRAKARGFLEAFAVLEPGNPGGGA